MTRMPSLYIPHGGGPCFFMEWTMGPADTWDHLAQWLKELGTKILPSPKAIVLVSAHWEENDFTVLTGEQPNLLFDYYGFPEHTYKLEYRAPGSPEIAAKIVTALNAVGIKCDTNAQRGYDHGVFIPLKLVYPAANIPIVQLSLRKGLASAEHISMGAALTRLRDEGVLIIGSGMSYHNLRKYFSGSDGLDSRQFDEWLKAAVEEPSAAARNRQLCNWEAAPSARNAHPREEHLIPLMVAAGAAGDDLGKQIYCGTVMGLQISGYQFG